MRQVRVPDNISLFFAALLGVQMIVSVGLMFCLAAVSIGWLRPEFGEHSWTASELIPLSMFAYASYLSARWIFRMRWWAFVLELGLIWAALFMPDAVLGTSESQLESILWNITPTAQTVYGFRWVWGLYLLIPVLSNLKLAWRIRPWQHQPQFQL